MFNFKVINNMSNNRIIYIIRVKEFTIKKSSYFSLKRNNSVIKYSYTII